MQICPSCGEENSDRARFCQACGEPLAAERAAPPEVRKTVTVVFSDVTESTSLGERLDPESLRRVMSRYFDEMRTILERHGGTVEKFIGDAIMAVFGVPAVHEDDATRAVRAASEMQEVLKTLNSELERDYGVAIATRTGVNTGEVVAGRVDPASGRTLVTGDAVNVASRLEQAAQPGEILIGDWTYRLVRDAVEAQPVAPLSLKGKSEAIDAYRLLVVHPSVPGVARRLDSPMVGRERQLRQLSEAFEGAAADRACYLFTVLGSAGVGKSRLAEEFLTQVTGEATVLRGRCLSYGEGITYWPVAEIVTQAAGIDSLRGAETARARIASLFEDEPEAPLITERLANVLGLVDGSSPAQEIFWATRRLFESMARRHPLVVLVEDIHWAEPTLLDAIEHVADLSRDAPILLACSARPELLDARPGWAGGKLNATTILLEPLSEDESRELIANLLGSAELDTVARDRIMEAAEGNPLFVEQMLAMLIDDGLLRLEDGRWAAAGDVSDLAVPATVQALLAARLDRLDTGERGVLERASVEGRSFHAEAVAALIPDADRSRLSHDLRSLVRREFIRPDRPTFAGHEAYRFRHQLIRDAAYEAIPKSQRAELHLQFAGWLETVAGESLQEYDEFLGYHLEQAYRYKDELGPVTEDDLANATRAGELLVSSGRRALNRGDRRGGANLLERSARLLPKPDPRRVRALLELGRCLTEAGDDFAGSRRVLEEALEGSESLGREDLRFRALLELAVIHVFTDPEVSFDEQVALAREAIEVLEQSADDEGLARAWFILSTAYWSQGQWDHMRDPLRHSIEHARRAGNRSMEIDALTYLLAAAAFGSTPVEEGIRLSRQVYEESPDSRELQGWATRFEGTLLALQGHSDEARELLEQARTTFSDLGNKVALAVLAFSTGALELSVGDVAAAEREYRTALEAVQRMGERGRVPNLAGLLAETLLLQGRIEEAQRYVAVAQEAAQEGETTGQAFWRMAAAQLLARRGEAEEAVRLAEDAVSAMAETDELLNRPAVLRRQAEVLELVGRSAEAASTLQQAIDLFERKGAAAEVRLVRDRLAALQPQPS
jgi:class 3 adenylate cyclase/tetratricopeptide (TPR) repeat protein